MLFRSVSASPSSRLSAWSISSPMKRLTWRTLRDTSDRPFLARSSSSSTIMGKKMLCSAKRNSAVGSCISTLVSRMYRRGRSAMGGAPGDVLGQSGQLAHGLEHVFDVAGHAHLAPFTHQPAVFVEQEGAALYAAHLAAEHVFVLHDAKLVAKNFIWVGNERERKVVLFGKALVAFERIARKDRKSTRLNSSHVASSYAVFCLK